MKRIAIALALALVAASPSYSAGLLKPKDSSLPALQIKDHRVSVVINNGFAVTEVDQVFHNPHDRDLDAIYTFPLPKNASLSELSLWIDGTEVVGEVVEKERAREIHQQEKDAGRDTALAEKREYLAFDLFVSPVRAGSDTRVRLVYLQPVEIDTGMGRYVYPLEEGRIDEELHAFWDRMPRVHGQFAFQCLIRSSYPLDDVRAKGFDDMSRVTQSAPDTWIVNIDGEEGSAALDQDVVIYYRLAEDLPARVDLLAHRVDEEPGTFMIVVTPGADLEPITEGIDWSVVLDVSGSMSGDKIVAAAEGIARALDEMREEDRFRLIAFNDRADYVMREWTPVTPGSVDEARRRLLALPANGGTNVHAGMEMGLDGLEPDRTSALIIVSDGGANVGPTGHRDFLELLEKRDVRVFTFVIGQGANRPLLERIAAESGGFSLDVSNRDDLYGRIVQAKAKMGREALHGVEVVLDGVPVMEVAPSRLPSAYHGQQITVLGRYADPGPATLRLKARISGQEKLWETRILLPEFDEDYPELERLWALARVKDLKSRIDGGESTGELRESIVDLGIEYSIVTDYTSMIVVREEQYEKHGIDRKNKRRVEGEREARDIRTGRIARDTRADAGQPMFNNKRAPSIGGGAAGPAFAGLLAALLGARELARRRRRK